MTETESRIFSRWPTHWELLSGNKSTAGELHNSGWKYCEFLSGFPWTFSLPAWPVSVDTEWVIAPFMSRGLVEKRAQIWECLVRLCLLAHVSLMWGFTGCQQHKTSVFFSGAYRFIQGKRLTFLSIWWHNHFIPETLNSTGGKCIGRDGIPGFFPLSPSASQ